MSYGLPITGSGSSKMVSAVQHNAAINEAIAEALYPLGVRLNVLEATGWVDAEEFALRAEAAAASVLAYDGGPGIRPVLSSLIANAQDNSDAIADALALAQTIFDSTGVRQTIYIATDTEVPIAEPIKWPNAGANKGNFIWYQTPGTVIRPYFGDGVGFVQPEDRDFQVENCDFFNFTIDPHINPDDYEQDDRNGGFITIPGGTRPFNGSGWTGRYKNCRIIRPTVLNYFDDQGFIYGLNNCIVVEPYWYCVDTITGTGGHRLFEAINSFVYGARGTSPDDAFQFCPVDSAGSPYFNLVCRDSFYIGGTAISVAGRALVFILDEDSTTSITNCGFIGVQCRGSAGQTRALVFGTGAIINPLITGCMFDGSAALLEEYGQRFEHRITGDVRNPQFEICERNLQATFFQIQEWTPVADPVERFPRGGFIDLKSTVPALDEILDDADVPQPFYVVELSGWRNGRIRMTVAGSQLQDAVKISNTRDLFIEQCDISATPVGFSHILHQSTALRTFIESGNLTGDGDNFTVGATANKDFTYDRLCRAGEVIDPRAISDMNAIDNPPGPRRVTAATIGDWPALAPTPTSGRINISKDGASIQQTLYLQAGNLAFVRWYNGAAWQAWKTLRPVTFTATFDPPSLADGAGVTTTLAAAGAVVSDFVSVSHINTQDMMVMGWISAADVASVRFQNESGGTLDLGSGTLRAGVMNN
jgi:hypothetical protein